MVWSSMLHAYIVRTPAWEVNTISKPYQKGAWPKSDRKMERKRSTIHDNPNTSEQTLILHTTVEDETLTRMIMDAVYISGGTAGYVTTNFLLDRTIGGTSIAEGPSVTTVLDRDVRKAGELLRWPMSSFQNSTNGQVTLDRHHIDTKAQRKLEEDDTIRLRWDSTQSVGNFVIDIVLFLKQN